MAIVIASLALPLTPARAAPAATAVRSLHPHLPIDIEGDAGFTSSNGVVGGQGTLADPYLIADWAITSPPALGVQVRNTRLHAVFQNVSVSNAPIDAFYFFNATNVTLSNVTAYVNEGEGIRFEDSHAFSIVESNLTANLAGLVLINSADGIVRGTSFTANSGDGIAITGSPNVTLEDNDFLYNGFSGAGHGIDLTFTTGDVVRANRFIANGIVLAGDSLPFFDSHTITPDNLVAGLPILYEKDCSGLTLAEMALGQLLLAGCRHVRISNLTVAGGDVGVEIAFGTDAVLGPGVLVSGAAVGVEILQTSAVQVVGVQILNTGVGIEMDASTGVRVSASKISAPFANADPNDGVIIRDSDRVNVTGNVIRRHRNAIFVSGSGNLSLVDNLAGLSVLGLNASRSHDFQVSGNLVVQDSAGLRLENVTNATFAQNALLGIATTGANLSASSGVEFVHNLFGGRVDNAYDAQGSRDAWDGGYPAGGNSWGNYGGVDVFQGVGQNLSGADGIGDTPYMFDVNAVDHYPLMSPPVTVDVPPEALFLVGFPEGYPITPFHVTANLSSDLEDPLGVLQVRWFWDDAAGTPWTATKDATHVFGTTGVHSIRLEVKDSAGLTDNWTTPILILSKPDGLPPVIRSAPPASAEVGQPIPITANVTDASAVANVTLLYQGVDGGPLRPVPMQVEDHGTNFTATIPAQPRTGTVTYVVVANDTWGNAARAPVAGSSSVRIVDTFTPLVIGSVLAAVSLSAVAVAFLLLRRRRKRAQGESPPAPPASPPGNP